MLLAFHLQTDFSRAWGYYMKGFYDKDKMIQNNLLRTLRSLREYENILPV